MPIVADTDAVHIIEAGIHSAVQGCDVVIPGDIDIAIQNSPVAALVLARVQCWRCGNGVIVYLQKANVVIGVAFM